MRARWEPEWGDIAGPDLVEAMRSEYLPEMPPVDAGQYLLNYLLEVGPTEHTGMGDRRLSNVEIGFWQSNMGFRLRPWEIRMLRRLSGDYQYAAWLAEKRDATPPWAPDATTDDLEIVAKSLKQTIRDLAKL